MKYASLCMALALIVATCFPGQATSEPNQSDANSAAQLFKAGKFTQAGDIYARIVAQDPKDYSAVLQLGRVALLANRLDDAERWFEAAIALQPGDDDAKVMLAEALYRRDDFQKAAAALGGVEVGTNRLIIEQYPTLNVAKLESFKGQTPYEVHGDGQTTRLKFLNTPSLPVVSVRGGDEVTFFIDTGGSELGLDTDSISQALRPRLLHALPGDLRLRDNADFSHQPVDLAMTAASDLVFAKALRLATMARIFQSLIACNVRA